jgi:hypothetical protein
MALGERCAEIERAGRAGHRAALAQCIPSFDAALTQVEAEIAGLLAMVDA